MSTPVPTPTPTPTTVYAPKREYDQFLSGDVKIKKIHNSNKEYEIKFSKKNLSKVLMYQVWSSTSAALNGSRKVKEVKAKDWVKMAFPKNPPAVPFTPTTVMELHDDECDKGKDKKHVFVINNAKVKDDGHIVFHVSSKDIDLNNTNKVIKKLKKIPTTKKGEMFHNARFDIDALIDALSVQLLSFNGMVQSVSGNLFESIFNISNSTSLTMAQVFEAGNIPLSFNYNNNNGVVDNTSIIVDNNTYCWNFANNPNQFGLCSIVQNFMIAVNTTSPFNSSSCSCGVYNQTTGNANCTNYNNGVCPSTITFYPNQKILTLYDINNNNNIGTITVN